MKELFVGTWALVASTFRAGNGAVTYPLGEQAEGLLVYDEMGTVAAQLSRPQRPPFHATDSAEERGEKVAAAYQGYTAYFGHYTINPEQGIITHHVRASLNPNWIGSEQIRFFHFSPDYQQLTLSTPPLGREQVIGQLIWRRKTQTDSGKLQEL